MNIFTIVYTILMLGVSSNSQLTNSFLNIDLIDNWILRNTNRSIEVKELTIPISVHTALRKKNLIPEPYYRFNDLTTRWVAYDENWTFENTFRINDAISLSNNRIDLVFYQIDTIASIFLNEKFILFTDNQFIKHTVENINSKLIVGLNKLEIKFRSAVIYAKNLASIYPYRVPPECWGPERKGECFGNFVRKEQCSFSWDWGPAFATMAINEMISLKFISLFTADISTAIHPQTIGQLQNWTINSIILVSQNEQNKFSSNGEFEIAIPELNYSFKKSINLDSSSFEISANLSTTQYLIELWFPNGYGGQKLYEVILKIKIGSGIYETVKFLGFRSVQLIQDPMPGENNGLSFYFKINNIPIFLKGSNWIPADSFKENITDEYLDWLMFSAKDSHINILRVWGGGIYADEKFYNLADKYGIMIWQDFMFACATYPTNLEFLRNVENEIRYQVLRLRGHPSLVVWAGNNENEALVGNNWFGTNSDRSLYEEDYRKLYIDLIQRLLTKLDSVVSRPYLSSSPTNGDHSGIENPNWVSQNPQDLKYGDMHFYDYYFNSWEPSSWPIPRLSSEFGIQSFPSYSTLEKVYEPNDMDFYGELNEHRQHSTNGNALLEYEIMYHTRTALIKNKAENFKNFIYLSQLNQAMTYKVYIELLRRNRDTFDEKTGIGFCMGAMYWQFNDIWQAPTWSSIEYGGKWKMSHYYVKRSFSPVLVSPNIDLNRRILYVHVVSDLIFETFNDTIVIKVFEYESFTARAIKFSSFFLEPLTTKMVFQWSLESIEAETGCKYNVSKSCIITFAFEHSAQFSDGENWIFMNNFFHTVENLKIPEISITSVEKMNNLFSIKIKSNAIALFVWIDFTSTEIVGRLEENGFHMTSEEKEVKLLVRNPNIHKEFLQANIQIRSLVLSNGTRRFNNFSHCLFLILYFF